MSGALEVANLTPPTDAQAIARGYIMSFMVQT
jgi:hypothetical protein